jgi:hypothetical protein
VGRARERVKLSEMRRGVCAGHWRGSKKGAGRVGRRRGQEIRRRARVRTRWSTASAEGAKLIGQFHGAERRKGGAGQRLGDWRSGPARQRERERAGEGNWRRQIGPTGQRAREGAPARGRTAADRRGPPVRRRGRVAWLGQLGPAGLLSLFLFLYIF